MKLMSVQELVDKIELLKQTLCDDFTIVSVGVSLEEYKRLFMPLGMRSIRVDGKKIDLDVSKSVRKITIEVEKF